VDLALVLLRQAERLIATGSGQNPIAIALQGPAGHGADGFVVLDEQDGLGILQTHQNSISRSVNEPTIPGSRSGRTGGYLITPGPGLTQAAIR